MQQLSISCLVNPQCALGESPFWDNVLNVLYWVDITANRIYRYDPVTKSLDSWHTPEHVGFVVLNKDGNLIAGLKSGLYQVQLLDNGRTSVSPIHKLREGANVRFNDGMIDAEGNIWCCTMDMNNTEALGKYYCYDPAFRVSIIDEGYIVANGPALSLDRHILYTVETVGSRERQKGIYAIQLNKSSRLPERTLLIDWSRFDSYPDGVITDKKGNLWIGEFGGNILRCFNSEGILQQQLALPAWNITKAAFKGAKADVLYVTTARIGVSEAMLLKYPNTGSIIEVSGLEE